MDERSKNLFKDMSNAKNFEPSSEIEVAQKGITFHSKKWNYVQSATRQ
jgi:hypothetical protein